MTVRSRLTVRSASVLLLAGTLGACRSRARPAPTEADPIDEPGVVALPAPTQSSVPVPPRCAAVARGAGFTVGEPDPGGEEAGQDLPFAVEIGRAAALEKGFAIGALGARGRGTAAFVALVGEDGASGRILDLGLTHGTFEPPVVATRGSDLYLVVPDSDAGGNLLRLGVARGGEGATQVTWGPGLSEGWDDSEAFDVAVGSERGIVVWDHPDEKEDHRTIRAVDFDPADLSQVSKARAIDLGSAAEQPRIVARPGGFWLAAATLHGSASSDQAGRRPDADEELDVSDRERRSVAVVPLDARGVPLGKPLPVLPVARQIVVFDLAVLADGSVLAALRMDTVQSQSAEGGPVHLARVKLDGSVTPSIIEGKEVGSGAPSLFADARPGGDRSTVWLALAGVGDEGELMALAGDGRARDALAPEPALGRGEVLARRGDHLLVVNPRGRSVEVSTLRCRPGTSPPPASSHRPAFVPPAKAE
ncbi:MAG: hypothetical protein JW751_13055 [Polyangiaceae bacterium]|nr:hypothetical protein [Polyangiaceae bacterium]